MAAEWPGAERVSAEIGRDDETVIGWVPTYNTSGPAASYYPRRGDAFPL